jgi:formyl-CoA transferase
LAILIDEVTRQPKMQPLAGVLVVDFTHAAAGPFATMLLGDFGATVIKIEKPGRGDPSRHSADGGPTIPYQIGSLRFMGTNRNKLSIGLDLSTDIGVEIARGLAAKADVVVENFRPGAMQRLGLDYARVRSVNPRVVYCSVSGFGSKGSRALDPGMDLLAQALAGTIAITGEVGGPPVLPGLALADLSAGLQAALGIMLALRVRDRDGIGQRVEVSLLDASLMMLSNYAGTVLNSSVEIPRSGRSSPQLAPYGGYLAEDGWVFIACGTNRFFRALCRLISSEGLINDPRFVDNRSRVANRKDLDDLIAGKVSQNNVAHWLHVMHEAGIPCAPLATPREGFRLQEAEGYPIVQSSAHPDLGNLDLPGLSILLSETPGSVRTHPPRLGEHTAAVLSDFLEITPDRTSAWERDGVVGTYKTAGPDATAIKSEAHPEED